MHTQSMCSAPRYTNYTPILFSYHKTLHPSYQISKPKPIFQTSKRASMDTSKRSIRILMFPWLAHGHISPFLQLAKSLSNHNFISYICSTQATLNSIKPSLTEKDSISIKLVQLQILTTPDLPPHYHTTNGLPPHLMGTLKKHLDASRPEFSKILETLMPDIVLYDFLQPWAPLEAYTHGIPSVLFYSTGAAITSYLMHQWIDPESEYPFSSIYFREHEFHIRHGLVNIETEDDERLSDCVGRSSDIVLIKTFRALEGKYIDYLSPLTGKKFVPVGGLIQSDITSSSHKDENGIIEWLDKREERSTIFASFGSEYFLTENELEGIALGLERSGFDFIWVVRFPIGEEKVKLKEVLPGGFFDRVGERGLVVEGWVPQREILGHTSVAGFLSHCGWSSVMEAIYFGVPIIAMPMHLDQPLNARMVEEVGFGKEVVRDKDGKLDGGEVARVAKMVMEDIGGVRRKVDELRENMLANRERDIEDAVKELMTVLRTREGSNLAATDSMKDLNIMLADERVLSTNV